MKKRKDGTVKRKTKAQSQSLPHSQPHSQTQAQSQNVVTVMTSSRFMITILVSLTFTMVLVNVVLMKPLEDVTNLSNGPAHSLDQQQQQFAQSNRLSEEEGLDHIRSIFKEANITLTPKMLQDLPTWNQIQDAVGTEPKIHGLDSCAHFQSSVPPIERMLGSAGMFNTGTNLVTHLLKRNCEIPERRAKYGPKASKEQYGMRWQVPWGKHTPAKFRLQHATEKASAIRKEYLLPVVAIRNPYTWFQRMCTNGYTATWEHDRRNSNECPNLKTLDGDWNQVTTKYADGRGETHRSLAHLWNDWYHDYYLASDFPRIIVRLEDLIYYAKETTTQVCECAGGRIRTDQPFQYVVESAKADSRGHDASVGFYQAWLKYAKPYDVKGGLRDVDYDAAVEALDGDMMRTFGYEHPPSGQE